MLPKHLSSVLFAVILCITLIRCDVSHIVHGSQSPVDAGTMETLKRDINEYLVHLEHGGSPQMHLQQILSASKEIVTGTLYTVQAVLTTPEGPKNCEIRVLEKAWIDFCKVSVSCEHGGHYEVTLNSHKDVLQHLSTLTHVPGKRYVVHINKMRYYKNIQ